MSAAATHRAATPPAPWRLGINGYGRIGRSVLRALFEAPRAGLSVRRINEPADLASMAHLTRFDSTHGRFGASVDVAADSLLINGEAVRVTHATNPEDTQWDDLDVLVECSGQYHQRPALNRFLTAGVPRLLLSHPGASAEDVDATIIPGLGKLSPPPNAHTRILSAGSCTTNAAAPVLAILDQTFGVEAAVLTTIHSVMNDQPLIDGYHAGELDRTRSAMQSIIPVQTGLARGIERLLPALQGRVEARALRVPVVNVSAIEMTIQSRHAASTEAMHAALAAASSTTMQGVLALGSEPCASIDFNHDTRSAIIDTRQTRAVGSHLLSVLIWFDNEWAFANRLLDVLALWHKALAASKAHDHAPQHKEHHACTETH